jgi:hypothetical protein
LLEDLGFKSLQPVQPSATDTLKSNIVEALQSLGYQPEISKRPALPSNADPLDIKIRELEDQLESRNATKPEDPRAAKIAELTALLEKANAKTSDPRAVKFAELTALLEKANKKPTAKTARDEEIEDLELRLSGQESVIKRLTRDRKKLAEAAAWKTISKYPFDEDEDDTLIEDDTFIEEEVTPAASFSPKKQKTHKQLPTAPSPHTRGRSPAVATPKKSPRAKRGIDVQLAPCLDLVSHLNQSALNADTMCTPGDLAHSLAQFDFLNLREFLKHFNIPHNDTDTTPKTLLRKKNLEAIIAVLQSRCLVALE